MHVLPGTDLYIDDSVECPGFHGFRVMSRTPPDQGQDVTEELVAGDCEDMDQERGVLLIGIRARFTMLV